MTQRRETNGRCPGTQNCRGTLLAILFSALWFLHSGGVVAQTSANTGSIKGQVVVVDATGSSYLPGAQVLLNGPVNLQTESDANGQYNFPSVIPGTYTIQATAPALRHSSQSLSIPARPSRFRCNCNSRRPPPMSR